MKIELHEEHIIANVISSISERLNLLSYYSFLLTFLLDHLTFELFSNSRQKYLELVFFPNKNTNFKFDSKILFHYYFIYLKQRFENFTQINQTFKIISQFS